MLAVGEVIARHYGHPSQVHQTVMAGATWEQTAAATGGRQRDDGISGVCLYRVPAGWKAAGILPAAPACQGHRFPDGRQTRPGDLVSAGEVIQPHHRYMVAPPPVHPSGRPYRWIGGGLLSVAGLPTSPTSGQTANGRGPTRHHDAPASTDSQTASPPTPRRLADSITSQTQPSGPTSGRSATAASLPKPTGGPKARPAPTPTRPHDHDHHQGESRRPTTTPARVISTMPRTLTLSRLESRLPLGSRRACRTRTGTSPAIVIRRGCHHLPQAAASQPLFSWSSACPLNPVIRFAIGRRQVTMTDCDEQSVIRSLQSAHNADSARPPPDMFARASARITAGSVRCFDP
jgi:hypothetical protein